MASMIGIGQRSREAIAEEAPSRSDTSARDVFDLIEKQIIPRMLNVHWKGRQKPVAAKGHIAPGDIDRFAPLTIELEADALLDEVEAYLKRGLSADSLLVDLLAPTARKLGEYWEEDRCDFVDVTMGLWRLQQIMREISARRGHAAIGIGHSRRALFSTLPGDQHHFGTLMVEEYFAHSGWDTDIIMEAERADLLERCAKTPYDIAGLTISNDCPSDTIASLLRAMRSVARNPNMRILIGGWRVNENPDLVAESGADGTASTPQQALVRAEELLDALLPQQSQIQ